MTIYLHDGTEFDLDCEFIDVTGVIWSWTDGWSYDAEPILRSDGPGQDLPLPEVDLYHGPLIPRRSRLTTAPSRVFAETAAAGYVEDDEAFAARIGGAL